MKLIIVLMLFLLSTPAFSQKDVNEFEKMFSKNNGGLALYDESAGKYFFVNENRCMEKFLPASTFKIPNSVIGLETGVIKNENFIIPWDGKEREIKEWNGNHSLASAIKFSVVPYYQELARRVGRKKMQNYLADFGYGNRFIGERIDTFWLDNSLLISMQEQIEFLRKFYFYELPASKKNIDVVKKIMSSEIYDGTLLKYKTGGGRKENGEWIGWLVGYIEKETKSNSKNVFFFALNVDGKSFNEVSNLRMKLAKEFFTKMNLIPKRNGE